jgi:MFS family permease
MALSPTARIRAVFFLHALGSGGLYPRLPDIQQQIGLNVETLGLALAGYTIGTILIFFFVSRLIETFGPRTVLLATLPAVPIATALIAVMPNASALFAWLIVYGIVYALPNAAMNVEADRVEAAAGGRVMNSCHGVWSAGYLLASLIGTLAEGFHVGPLLHLGLLAIPVALGAVWVTSGMTPAPPRAHAAQTIRRVSMPTLPILLLVAFAVGPNLLEGAMRNWSVLYMRDSFAAPSWVDTLTLPVFLVAQALGRLRADSWVTRFGVVPTARTLTIMALIGGLVIVLAPSLDVALFGFLLIGVGVCTTYPLTTSAAARIGDRPSSQNVASLTLANQLVQLAAPPAMGWIAAGYGLRHTFTLALPFLALSIWLARDLVMRRRG